MASLSLPELLLAEVATRLFLVFDIRVKMWIKISLSNAIMIQVRFIGAHNGLQLYSLKVQGVTTCNDVGLSLVLQLVQARMVSSSISMWFTS